MSPEAQHLYMLLISSDDATNRLAFEFLCNNVNLRVEFYKELKSNPLFNVNSILIKYQNPYNGDPSFRRINSTFNGNGTLFLWTLQFIKKWKYYRDIKL